MEEKSSSRKIGMKTNRDIAALSNPCSDILRRIASRQCIRHSSVLINRQEGLKTPRLVKKEVLASKNSQGEIVVPMEWWWLFYLVERCPSRCRGPWRPTCRTKNVQPDVRDISDRRGSWRLFGQVSLTRRFSTSEVYCVQDFSREKKTQGKRNVISKGFLWDTFGEDLGNPKYSPANPSL